MCVIKSGLLLVALSWPALPLPIRVGRLSQVGKARRIQGDKILGPNSLLLWFRAVYRKSVGPGIFPILGHRIAFRYLFLGVTTRSPGATLSLPLGLSPRLVT